MNKCICKEPVVAKYYIENWCIKCHAEINWEEVREARKKKQEGFDKRKVMDALQEDSEGER